MENKSLNIFNSKLVLASPETATDADYAAILGVIGHEYFHNWTGNRVTCRDCFQRLLKKGLTIFRDQDVGPMAHPVRPHSYIKAYEKGAGVVRMSKTLLGSSGFWKELIGSLLGSPFFCQRQTTNGLSAFAHIVLINIFANFVSQEVPPTPGQPVKGPMFIPVATGLLDSSGKDMPLTTVYNDGMLQTITSNDQPVFIMVLRVKKREEEFVFSNIPERPILSLLWGYSAPVHLDSDLTVSDLFFLLANDSDEFNRWKAGQVLVRKLMLSLVADFRQKKTLVLNPKFADGIRTNLCNSTLDKEFFAKTIILPGEG